MTRKRTDSLLFRFALMFALFVLLAISMSGVLTFAQQTASYKTEREKSIQQIADYLEKLILQDGEDFLLYKNYMVANYKTLKIPHDFTQEDVFAARDKFYVMFSSAFPGKAFGVDVAFDELPEEIKEAFVIFKHEFYTNEFEKARQAFKIPYTYVCVPTGESYHMWWLVDVEREVRSDGYLNLCIDVLEVPEKHRCMWEAWESGKKPKGYDYYDNEYGKTYAYYTPLCISGEKVGVIGVECEVSDVNRAILRNSLHQTAIICAVLVLLALLFLAIEYKKYISKLCRIKTLVSNYSETKDIKIACELEKDFSGKDEISVLALQVPSMILELDNYMKSFVETSRELIDAKKKAKAISDLSEKDALTGIRNKTAYNAELSAIDECLSTETFEFALAVINFNSLKIINDKHGMDKGNLAIKELCYIVCHVFEHSPVFKIGGDEFAVVLTGSDFKNREMLYTIFNRKIETLEEEKELEAWQKVSAAIGIAVYNRDIDDSAKSVHERAKKEMFEKKQQMKGGIRL